MAAQWDSCAQPRPAGACGSKAPARGQRRDARRNQSAVLEAASRLLAEKGIEHLTMDVVAERAGVGKGTVFRHFGSRSGLVSALLERLESRWDERIAAEVQRLGAAATPCERLVAVGRVYEDLVREHAALLDAAGRGGHRSLRTRLQHLVGTILDELAVPGDREVIAASFLVAVESVASEPAGRPALGSDRVLEGWARLVEQLSPGGARRRTAEVTTTEPETRMRGQGHVTTCANGS